MIGMSLHELEDFYAHSNWVEEPGVTGADGPDWSDAALRHEPDLVRRAGEARLKEPVYIGGTPDHPRKHLALEHRPQPLAGARA